MSRAIRPATGSFRNTNDRFLGQGDSHAVAQIQNLQNRIALLEPRRAKLSLYPALGASHTMHKVMYAGLYFHIRNSHTHSTSVLCMGEDEATFRCTDEQHSLVYQATTADQADIRRLRAFASFSSLHRFFCNFPYDWLVPPAHLWSIQFLLVRGTKCKSARKNSRASVELIWVELWAFHPPPCRTRF